MGADPMLEEIWRVREQLIKKYGGLDGYYKHLAKVYRAHEKYARRHKLRPEGPDLWEIEAAVRGRRSKKNSNVDATVNGAPRARAKRKKSARPKRKSPTR
jgi:hypothetical protein